HRQQRDGRCARRRGAVLAILLLVFVPVAGKRLGPLLSTKSPRDGLSASRDQVKRHGYKPRAVSSAGRAPALQPGGRRVDPVTAHRGKPARRVSAVGPRGRASGLGGGYWTPPSSAHPF